MPAVKGPETASLNNVPSGRLLPDGPAIGSLKLKSPLILAPLAGISDLPYRLLNRSFGAELAFVEMVSARSLSYDSGKTREMLVTVAEDRPLGVQLLGSDPEILKRAMDLLQPMQFDLLDLNAACPVPKVTSRGEGAGMLKEPLKIARAVKALAAASPVPVTLKMRIGWDESSISAADIAKRAEGSGAAAIFIHGRTREQGYAGAVWYDVIAEVKRSVKIPVIASGDALSPMLVKRLFDETGCDGVAMARGALGNPWIFRDITAFLSTGRCPSRPPLPEIIGVMRRHIGLLCDHYGERDAIVMFRKFFSWYAKGFRYIRPMKQQVFGVTSRDELIEILGRIEKAAPEVLPLYESYQA